MSQATSQATSPDVVPGRPIQIAEMASGANVEIHVALQQPVAGSKDVGHAAGADQFRHVVAIGDAFADQVGRARLSDDEMLSITREALTSSKLGVFLLPGWATIGDIKNAIAHEVDLVRIGTHCTEADLAERHLGFLRDQGVEAHGVLLMSHMASPGRLAEECARLVGFGATGVGILDSSGHYLPADVTERIRAIRAAVDVPVMFHGHNNLGMAVANSIAAAEADETTKGAPIGTPFAPNVAPVEPFPPTPSLRS